MRLLVFLSNSTSALVLFSSLALVTARLGGSPRANQRKQEWKATSGDDGVRNRSPQAIDQAAQQQVKQPYEYGFGPGPGDADATIGEVTKSLVTPSGGLATWNATSSGLWVSSATSEQAAGETGNDEDAYPQETHVDSRTPTTETATSSDKRSTPTDTDDEYPQEDPPEETTPGPDDSYPPQEASTTDGYPASPTQRSSDPYISGQRFSSSAEASVRINENSTDAVFSQATASEAATGPSSLSPASTLVETLPPFTNVPTVSTLPLSGTLSGNVTSSDMYSRSTRTLGTSGNQEPPLVTPTNVPTWTVSGSIPSASSLSSPAAPFPGNDTGITSVSGTRTEGVEESAASISTTRLLNTTSSVMALSKTETVYDVTVSDQPTGGGIIRPTVRPAATSDAIITSALSFSPSNVTVSSNFTQPVTIVTSTSLLGNATASWSSSPGVELPAPATGVIPLPTSNTSLSTGLTAAPGTPTSTPFSLSPDGGDDDPTMAPGSWNKTRVSDTPAISTSGASANVTTGQSITSLDDSPSLPALSINTTWVLSGTAIVATITSPLHVLTSVIQPSSRPSMIAPPSNATSSEVPGLPGTASLATSRTGDFPSSPPLPSLPIPPADTAPPWPQPNTTSLLPAGSGIPSEPPPDVAPSGTFEGTWPWSLSSSTPNNTTSQPAGTGVPGPLPPLTLDNTTITFPPVTEVPFPPTSVSVPFPMPNVTVSRTFNGTGSTLVPVPTPPETMVSGGVTVSGTTPSQSVLTGSDGPLTAPTASISNETTNKAPWPPINTTIPWPISTTTRWPGDTTVPVPPVNTTVSANTTASEEPDSTGTLFEWSSESSEAPSNATAESGDPTATRTTTVTLPTATAPFPQFNSTRLSQTTGGLPAPSTSGLNSTRETTSTVDDTLVISRTVIVQPSADAALTVSLEQEAPTAVNGTLILSRTVVDGTTRIFQFNTTQWQDAATSPPTLLPPSQVTPFPNSTTTSNATWGISGTVVPTRSVIVIASTRTLVNATVTVRPSTRATLTRTLTVVNGTVTVRPTTRTIAVRTRTTTWTSSTRVTATAAPAATPACITITVTRGNVTERITKTITQPHPGVTGSASLVDQEGPTTDVTTRTTKTSCSSTTKKSLTTSCTSDLPWLNGTLSTVVVSLEATTSRGGSLANISSVTSAVAAPSTSPTVTISRLSSFTSSNATQPAVPGATTLRTLTTREPGIAPFNRVPTITASDEPLPSSPNYPWGGTGPLHRHHNITALASGSGSSSRGLLGRGLWSLAREHLGRLAALWDVREAAGPGETGETGLRDDALDDEEDLVGVSR